MGASFRKKKPSPVAEDISESSNQSKGASSDSENEDETGARKSTAKKTRHTSDADQSQDKDILKARFKVLNKGKDSKSLQCNSAFSAPAYSENQFCQGLIKELQKSKKPTKNKNSDNQTVSLEEFQNEVLRWQSLDDTDKLLLMFSSMLPNSGDGGNRGRHSSPALTQDMLCKVLQHSLPSSYSESECKLLARAMIDTMKDNDDDDGVSSGLTFLEYKQWASKNIKKEKLKESLELKMSKTLVK